MRITLITLTLLLALASTASAARHQPWSHVTRPPIPKPMPAVMHEPCPGNEEASNCHLGIGEADMTGRVFDHGAIFLTTRSRFAKLHELGHAYDETMMDSAERTAYARLRDMNDLLWTWSETDASGATYQSPGTPAEDFADAYADCRMQRTPWGLWESGYGYYPRPREHWRICRLIARAGVDLGAHVSADGDR